MDASAAKRRAARNRTLELSMEETEIYRRRLMRAEDLTAETNQKNLIDRTICGDAFEVLGKLPARSFDLLFADPPYNLTKNFGENSFRQTSAEDYERWLDSWLSQTVRLLKPTASVYLCGDWRSSGAIERAASKYFTARNRITWEREKGRGAARNWKNSSEDIWFFTVSSEYVFNPEAVKIKRRVVAPYRTENGAPKDWEKSRNGNYRLTAASNLWTDLTVPFWSMPENTRHPTQKPEKLLAKIILASTAENALILDPFLGSGTTGAVARKLNRRFVGIERDEQFCLLAEKRLALAAEDTKIQGFADGVFWERNSRSETKKR